MKLENGMNLHGFEIRTSQELPELKATLHRMEYVKNGADLVWLERPDDNKTFSIGFKTIPSDDTGVFHILEHSVLCGSHKYPVREPFVELIKSSLQTFLNAMTFPDKTLYPLSSRNDQDFLNLIDVYMDAVLHPLSVESPLAFLQEGWHYELDDPEGELVRNGVVFNEMKGAFGDPGQVLSYELCRALFPDNCYGYESGGHPEHIPELTYEKYLENHRRYYSPSNAYIFLDGEMDIDAVLAKLDSYLSAYDRIRVDAEIPLQKPVHPGEVTAVYEIGPEEDGTDKVLVGEGWVTGRFDEPERAAACSVLARVLCGTNESPLKKALLEKGLAQDVDIHSYDGIQQNFLFLAARNTSLDKKDELVETVYDVLRQQARGLDHKELNAILNEVEFANREKDFGRMPRGLVFAMLSLESWLYGGDPAQNLCSGQVYASLRQKIDEGWFEKLLEEVFLENPHTARVVLLPSNTVGQERQAREKAQLEAVKKSWTQERTESVIREFGELRRHQSQSDSPEALASLPVLSLSDIPEETPDKPYSKGEYRGVPLLRTDVETGGIVYLDMHFTADDLTPAELTRLPALCELFGALATEKHSALETATLIREKIGRFSVSCAVYPGREDKVTPVFTVSLAVLPERKEEALQLVREILFTTDFNDPAAVYNILRQGRIGLEQRAMNAGNAVAVTRAASALFPSAALDDAMSGIGQLRFLQRTEREFEERGNALLAGFDALRKKLLIRPRLTLSVSGEPEEKWLRDVTGMFPYGEKGVPAVYTADSHGAEGFTIPAAIGFAGRALRLSDAGMDYSGAMLVASNILTLDHLWNSVRVKGGAYGVNMNVSFVGTVGFSSFRDPHCAGSLDAFARCGQALRDFVSSGEKLDRFIISTIGSLEPIMTPRQELGLNAILHFTGRGQADLSRLRSQVLHAAPEELLAFADALDKLSDTAAVCVVGAQPVLDACGEKLEKVESIQ